MNTYPSSKLFSAPQSLESHSGDNEDKDFPAAECICSVVSNDQVNDDYKLMILDAPPVALKANAGQFFQLLCISSDDHELATRRPMSIYEVDVAARQIKFLYKCVGRGTQSMALLKNDDSVNIAGPFGVGFSLEKEWNNVAVLGRGVGLATLAPISQLASEKGVEVTAFISARSPDLLMSQELFEKIGAKIITVTDADGTSSVENLEKLLEKLIEVEGIDAFFTCGSTRLLNLVKKLGLKHGIPGQVALEQIMACGLGPCYICVRTFEVNGKQVLRRVCKDGPVFNIQEAIGW